MSFSVVQQLSNNSVPLSLYTDTVEVPGLDLD